MRKICFIVLSLGLAATAFSSDNQSIEPDDDWEAESPVPPEMQAEEQAEPASDMAPQAPKTTPIYYGESSDEELTLNPNAKPRTYRMGFSLALDMFSENRVANRDVKQGNVNGVAFSDHFGLDGGLFFVFDIFPQLDFYTGFNFLFHHGFARRYYSEGDGIEYYQYILEFPAEFRYFLPLEKGNVRPFASFITHIRKPIHQRFEYDYHDETSGTIELLIDWDFMENLGIGVEWNKRFFAQYQLLLVSVRTHDGKVFGVYDAGINTWRLSVGCLW